jgi:hypothetical protein
VDLQEIYGLKINSCGGLVTGGALDRKQLI